MKQILILVIALLSTVNLYAQKMANDTLPEKRAVKSNWAIKIESGAIYHQMFNPDYIDNKATQITEVTVCYKNFYWTYGSFIYEFIPNKNMTFDNVVVDNQTEIRSFNLNSAIGYAYNFHNNWSTDIIIGFNSTDFEISSSQQTNMVYQSDILMDTQFGWGIDRYIKLKRFNYLVIGLGIDYNTTDYSKVSPNMKPSSLNYSLTIGYKGFFKRKVD